MGTSWGYGPKSFEVEGGVDTVVALRVPHRGTIQQINLEQVGGADDGVFEIYDSENAAKAMAEALAGQSLSSGQSFSSTGSSEVTGGDPAVHAVLQGTGAITAGRFRANDMNRQYRNRDGSFSVPIRKLWMVINVQGAGIKSFALSMMIEPVDLGS